MTWQLIQADCIQAMSEMDEASIDAIVTDPPYGLEFMGKEWDRLGTVSMRETDGNGAAAGLPPVVQRGDTRQPGDDNYQQVDNPYGRSKVRYGYDTPTAVMQEWHHRWATEALRVLKPGGHLLAFGGTRTYHRLACAVEDAGFEIRDCLAWMYGSGFPKSLDVSKAIDKAAGAEREVTGVRRYGDGHIQRSSADKLAPPIGTFVRTQDDRLESAPATPEAQRWQGWGTALKPSHEPIVLARKPLVGNVASNVTTFGTGALNIDGTRIGTEVETWPATRRETRGNHYRGLGGTQYESRTEDTGDAPAGRWPANVVLDPEAAAMLDEQTGELQSGYVPPGTPYKANGGVTIGRHEPYVYEGTASYGDRGGASRFFKQISHEEGTDGATLDDGEPRTAHEGDPGDPTGDAEVRFRYVPKADREERDRGLEHRAEQPAEIVGNPGTGGFPGRTMVDGEWVMTGTWTETGRTKTRGNPHPTVKPVELMRWLCRLITPPGGTVLDPFAGSGSTGIAALREGFSFIGIEREVEYVEIARDRIIGDSPLFNVGAEVTA